MLIGSALGLTTAPAAQAQVLGEFRSLRRIGRRHQRVVARQAPFRPIVGRRHTEAGQIALHRLHLPPVLHADDVLVGDRLPDRHGGLGRLGSDLSGLHGLAEILERLVHGLDQPRQLSGLDGVLCHVGGDDLGCDLGQRGQVFVVGHRGFRGSLAACHRWEAALRPEGCDGALQGRPSRGATSEPYHAETTEHGGRGR